MDDGLLEECALFRIQFQTKAVTGRHSLFQTGHKTVIKVIASIVTSWEYEQVCTNWIALRLQGSLRLNRSRIHYLNTIFVDKNRGHICALLHVTLDKPFSPPQSLPLKCVTSRVIHRVFVLPTNQMVGAFSSVTLGTI